MQCISYSGYGDPAKQDKAKKKPEAKPKMPLLDPADKKKKDPKKKSQGEIATLGVDQPSMFPTIELAR